TAPPAACPAVVDLNAPRPLRHANAGAWAHRYLALTACAAPAGLSLKGRGLRPWGFSAGDGLWATSPWPDRRLRGSRPVPPLKGRASTLRFSTDGGAT